MAVILERKMLKNIEIKDARPLLQFENMTIEEARNNLLDVESMVNEQGFQNVRISIQVVAHITHSLRTHSAKLVVYGDRMETDEELAERQARANEGKSSKQKKLDAQRAKDLKELARLKALYEE